MHSCDLAREIFALMARHNTSETEGRAAMSTALIVSLVDNDVSKEHALRIFGEVWDMLAPLIKRTKAHA